MDELRQELVLLGCLLRLLVEKEEHLKQFQQHSQLQEQHHFDVGIYQNLANRHKVLGTPEVELKELAEN
ncbi:hypothetical protein TYRP_015748 [Tyrophagus putrescentiae]|nr:hypothetical protein TYRP_015748 [Tyrophagus putrescentiae]